MERRAENRINCYAKALLVGHNLPGYVRDISRSGCRLDFLTQYPLQLLPNMEVKIIPLEEVHLPAFDIIVTVRWQTTSPVYHSLGGLIKPVTGNDQKNLDSLLMYFNKLNSNAEYTLESDSDLPD